MEKETALKILRERHAKALFSERTALETFIPELKESEDEKIKKALINKIKCLDEEEGKEGYSFYAGDYTADDCIAWLEKQGKQSYWKPSEEQMQTLHAQLNEGVVTYPEDKRVLSTLYEDLMKIMLQEEKQDKKKETLCDKCRREQPSHSCQDITELGRCALEKQGEQKPVDKIEPKFKVGDIITSTHNNTLKYLIKEVGVKNELGKLDYVAQDISDLETKGSIRSMSISKVDSWGILIEQNTADANKDNPKFNVGDWIVPNIRCGGELLHIIDKDGKIYEIETPHGHTICPYIEYVDDNFHLWTIQDAKAGDVLFMDNGAANCVFIYKSFNNGIINKYASYNKFGFEGEHYLVLNDGYVIPATKEQRDLLFQKMKEAGYEWDSVNKELKRIE